MKKKHITQAVFTALGVGAAAGITLKILKNYEPAPVVPCGKMSCAPIVLVHGLGGWGEGSKLEEAMPHFGLMAGSIRKYLGAYGYDAYAASVNPVTSTWDRACELYAHLTGTRTDYGEAHAKAHGHDRFGPVYEKLGPDWPSKKIHLIAHSFGGATVRLFAQLCAEGSADERAATSEGELSPLFRGALGGRIVSITTLAAPHNGTTALLSPVTGFGIGMLEFLVYSLMAVNTIAPGFRKFFPCVLDQYGMAGSKGFIRTYKQSYAYGQSGESSRCDMGIDGAAEMNRGILCQPDIYYFSFAGDITHERRTDQRVPNVTALSPMTAEPALRMGQKCLLRVTPGGHELDECWLPNDGQVNTISALHPFNEPHWAYDPENIKPGVWQIMPVMENWDHYDFVGGFRLGGKKGVKAFYLSLAQMLENIGEGLSCQNNLAAH